MTGSFCDSRKLPESDPSASVPVVSAKDGADRAARIAAVARAIFIGTPLVENSQAGGRSFLPRELLRAAERETRPRCIFIFFG
jgi:hypothetical protein